MQLCRLWLLYYSTFFIFSFRSVFKRKTRNDHSCLIKTVDMTDFLYHVLELPIPTQSDWFTRYSTLLFHVRYIFCALRSHNFLIKQKHQHIIHLTGAKFNNLSPHSGSGTVLFVLVALHLLSVSHDDN